MEEQAKDEFLQGPRGTGVVPLRAGNLAVHEVTGDGMKQTRIVSGNGESYAQWSDRKAAEKAKYDEWLKANDRTGEPGYMEQFMPPEQRAVLEATQAAEASGDQKPQQQ